MSVSSHLTPEPERRLWVILEEQRSAARWSDARVWALGLLAAPQLAMLGGRGGGLAAAAVALLLAALLVAAFSLSPLAEAPSRLPVLEPALGKGAPGDALIVAEDIAKYAHSELVLKLDRYLGGGVSSTQYYEDIVALILLASRTAVRKQRLLVAAGTLFGLAEVCLFARLLA